jgi:hypothetical protein
VLFLWAKGLNAKDIHKEMFPVSGWKCFSRKTVHNLVADVPLTTKRLKRSCGSGWDSSQRASMLRVFAALVKRRDKCINAAKDMLRNRSFCEVRMSHVLRFISICDLFTDSPSYISTPPHVFLAWCLSNYAQGQLYLLPYCTCDWNLWLIF